MALPCSVCVSSDRKTSTQLLHKHTESGWLRRRSPTAPPQAQAIVLLLSRSSASMTRSSRPRVTQFHGAPATSPSPVHRSSCPWIPEYVSYLASIVRLGGTCPADLSAGCREAQGCNPGQPRSPPQVPGGAPWHSSPFLSHNWVPQACDSAV